jgi:ADP-ribosyl-[dinitrogen reductase] hydrolase
MLAGATYGLANIPEAWLQRLDAKVAEEIRGQVPALLKIAQSARQF